MKSEDKTRRTVCRLQGKVTTVDSSCYVVEPSEHVNSFGKLIIERPQGPDGRPVDNPPKEGALCVVTIEEGELNVQDVEELAKRKSN